jgi:hypothetical protein
LVSPVVSMMFSDEFTAHTVWGGRSAGIGLRSGSRLRPEDER